MLVVSEMPCVEFPPQHRVQRQRITRAGGWCLAGAANATEELPQLPFRSPRIEFSLGSAQDSVVA